jgi:hypothetical protein
VDGTRTTTPSLPPGLTTRNATRAVPATQQNPVGVGIESKSTLAPHGVLPRSQLDGKLKAPVPSTTPRGSSKTVPSPNSAITPHLIAHRTASLWARSTHFLGLNTRTNAIVVQGGKEAWLHRMPPLMIAPCRVLEPRPIQAAAGAPGGYRSTSIPHNELEKDHRLASGHYRHFGYTLCIQFRIRSTRLRPQVGFLVPLAIPRLLAK